MGIKTALASFLDFTSDPLQRFTSVAKTASEDPLEAAKKALSKADHTWTGWTWMHDPGGETMEGPGPQANWDRWEVTRLRALALEADQDEFEPSADLEAQAAAERAYGEACQEDAEEAQRHLDRCVQLCKRGDFEAALLEAKRAASIERKYGDDPTYSPLVKALEEVLDNLDEMSNGRTASGRDKHLEGKKANEEPDFSQCKTAAFNRSAAPKWQATFKKLRDGSWGLNVNTDQAQSGDEVLTIKRDGSRHVLILNQLVWKGPDVSFWTFLENAPRPAPSQPRSESPTPSYRREESGGTCDECGRFSRSLTPCTDSSGIQGRCCPGCARMSRYERSFA